MKTSKITSFFAKLPASPPSEQEGESGNGGPATESTTSQPKISPTTSAKPTALKEDRLGSSRAILIDSDGSDEENGKVQHGNDIATVKTKLSKKIIYESNSDSDTELEGLSLHSPLKPKRKVIVDDDEESASDSIDSCVTSVRPNRQARDSKPKGEGKEIKNGSTESGIANAPISILSDNDDEESSIDEKIISVSKCTKARRLKRRNNTFDEEESKAIEPLSDDNQSSENEVRLMRIKRKVVNASEDEPNSGEDWDVDRSVILGERMRMRKQSRYSELLKSFKARGRRHDYDNNEIPNGPMDRFMPEKGILGLGSNAAVSEDEQDDDDESDGFVVADDIIDGEKTRLSQQETSELPAEFSTRYQNDTEGNFRIYIEYLLHRTEDASYGNLDNIDTRFKVAISAVNRLMETCKDKVYSPVWKSHFTKDLETWPSMDFKAIYEPEHDCDACMITGKASTRSITLSGYPYDSFCFPIQVEERVRSSSPNLDEADEGSSMWLSYQKNRPTKDQYWIGSTCFDRARIYHALVHLQHDLCAEIRDFIYTLRQDLGDNHAAVPNSRQNLKYLTDRMEETRLTDKLWSLAKQRVNDALYFRPERKKNENMSKFLFI